MTCHDLRRIFLNRLRERGVSIDSPTELTGHKNLKTVMEYYRHAPRAQMCAAIKALVDAGEGEEDDSTARVAGH
ncbi:MAG: tyrosine-type recombinase/integrase [Planctomycetota bacterium]|nr:tyrosine-type recombinase/integrase [Planctomycetota bacterium]